MKIGTMGLASSGLSIKFINRALLVLACCCVSACLSLPHAVFDESDAVLIPGIAGGWMDFHNEQGDDYYVDRAAGKKYQLLRRQATGTESRYTDVLFVPVEPGSEYYIVQFRLMEATKKSAEYQHAAMLGRLVRAGELEGAFVLYDVTKEPTFRDAARRAGLALNGEEVAKPVTKSALLLFYRNIIRSPRLNESAFSILERPIGGQ